MKRMKKGLAVTPLPAAATAYEDPRIRFKRQSLMQDYDELFKETEAKRQRIEVMRKKKATLMAEVKFLRRKFNHLTENQIPQNPKPDQSLSQSQMKSKKVRNKGTMNSISHDLSQPALRFDSNRKGRVMHSGKELIKRDSVDLKKKQKMSHKGRREAALRNSGMIPDLNVKERKDAQVGNNAPFFDLNQISMEEEELQSNAEMMITMKEEPKMINSLGGGIEEHVHKDVKLLVCRNLGNGSSRGGKRKISWQDPVALRV
ncbi:hypothetical protein LINGRAHAP2_LOCUS2106 [Linum grandiflorum]